MTMTMTTLALLLQDTTQAAIQNDVGAQSSGGGRWGIYAVIVLAIGSLIWQWLSNRNRSAKLAEEASQEKDKCKVFERTIKDRDQEIQRLKAEVLQRPAFKEEKHPIATLGLSACGKTALTLKWTNPLIDIRRIPPNKKLETYSKPVSLVKAPNSGNLVLHSIEISDRGGEHTPDVLQQLIVSGVEAVILVVDVAKYIRERNDQVLEESHIQDQIKKHNKYKLELFFAPAITAKCKHYFLFINKTDVLQESAGGKPEQVDKRARELFKPLIEDMNELTAKFGVNLYTITGSASTGTGTPELYSLLLEKLLPEQARDEALNYTPTGYQSPVPHDTRRQVAGPAI